VTGFLVTLGAAEEECTERVGPSELGGSTPHLAALEREHGIPLVLGVLEASRQIPDDSQVAVDGVAGLERCMR
jgi:phosphohistidine swiveling domain-containing protein